RRRPSPRSMRIRPAFSRCPTCASASSRSAIASSAVRPSGSPRCCERKTPKGPRVPKAPRSWRQNARAHNLITGRSHCGNIAFALNWEPEPSEIPARACTCSFCRKHGGVWTSCPTGALKVTVKDRSLVSAYSFGTETADFHVCTACGVVPIVTSRIDGRLYAVVSVNAFENVEPSLLPRPSPTFDAEDEEARLSRPNRSCIAHVAL